MRKFDFQLHESVIDEDVEFQRDFFIPMPENYWKPSGERGVYSYVK